MGIEVEEGKRRTEWLFLSLNRKCPWESVFSFSLWWDQEFKSLDLGIFDMSFA